MVQDKQAIENRCYIWKCVKPSQVLADFSSQGFTANPLFFKIYFQLINTFLEDHSWNNDGNWISEHIEGLRNFLGF